MLVFDRLAREWQAACGAPSLSIAVLRRGALLHAAGYGTGTSATIYQTASLGKHFTAALALLLAASNEGPALDRSIASYLPELPEAWTAVTMRQLLSHTAGIPAAGYDAVDLARDYTDAEIVRAILEGGPLDFQPGSAWSYSNAGYVLAGIAIGRSTGTFYGDLLRDRIFSPLGMTTAGVTGPSSPSGYVRDGGTLAPAPYVSPTLNRLADGGLTLSVLDFASWEAALYHNWGDAVA
ncbi:MAG TPA: serine hydrolase domain-containing protein, partial [Bryobacteraceae bacterium]